MNTKKNCLIVFAFPHIYNWEKEVIKKFGLIFNVTYIFANEVFRQGGSNKIINQINEIISSKNVEVVIFDTDFVPYVDYNIIEKTNSNTFKILITFDNIVHGNLNLINGSYCDLVLTYDPLDVLKFRENNINSMFFTLEDAENSFKCLNLERDIDVLFYGDTSKFGRKAFLEELLKKGLNIHIVGPPDNIVSDEEILELINRSKIVLNLSFSNSFEHYNSFFPKSENELNRPLLQFKGRFLHSGLCKTVCVSEYAPSIGLIYSNEEVPTFSNIDECLRIVKNILNNEEVRIKFANNLHQKVKTEFDDIKMMNSILFVFGEKSLKISRRKFKANIYYKKYITRFKILTSFSYPKLIIEEISYLLSSNLFYFSISFIKFYIKTGLIITKSKLKFYLKND